MTRLENDLRAEYEKLVAHVDKMKETITQMNTTDVVLLIDKLRSLEKKVGLVYTLFRASVYSLVTAAAQQQQEEEEADFRGGNNEFDDRDGNTKVRNEENNPFNTNRHAF
ncbi:hypothetical protein G9A89_013013 [Geosiphon pyriformis]|nr:hypothetical protein G9A89_013013 [Geosiphon pyriformis]